MGTKIPHRKVVRIIVREVLRNGIVVEMLDKDKPENIFIPQKEFSWNQSMNYRPKVYKIGEELEARFLPQERTKLSIRQLKDPWNEAKKYRVGEVEEGEVINFIKDGIFVQLEPGINGLIRKKHLPLLPNQSPSNILTQGDKVQALVQNINIKAKVIQLNLTGRLEQLNQKEDKRKEMQKDIFENAFEQVQNKNWSANGYKLGDFYQVPPIDFLESILIIEDKPNERETLHAILHKEFGVPIDEVDDFYQASLKIDQRVNYSLIVIDLGLREESGVEVAQKILKVRPNSNFLFISSNPLAEKKVEDFFGQDYPFSVKDSNEIIDWVYKIIRGYHRKKNDPSNDLQNTSFVRQLGIQKLARRSLGDRLNFILRDLKKKLNISYAILLKQDPAKKKISILSCYPSIDQVIQRDIGYELYRSPVQNIIEQGQPQFGNHVNKLFETRYRNFFQELSYQSWYGCPIKLLDADVRHALVVLDEREKLSKKIYERIDLKAVLIQAALEGAIYLDFMKKYERRYSRGQLLDSLVHEVRNQLDGGIGSIASRLISINNKIKTPEDYLANKEKLLSNIAGLLETQKDIATILDAYSNLANRNFEILDINSIAHIVCKQLDYYANEAQVKLILQLEENIPFIRVIKVHLQQALTNIVLNAIQQVKIWREERANIKTALGPEKENDWVSIYTCFCKARKSCQVFVMDTGPGIPYDIKNRIFHLGVSSRKKGHGLGLYISRDLIEFAGGSIHLLDSIRFIGSVFMLEFPIKP